MKKQKAIISFAHVKDNDLTEYSQLIHDKLTANPHFPTPTPTLILLQTGITDYSKALIKSKDGTKQDTADKNAKRLVLEGYLSTLGNYVNLTADGDLVMLEGSGFPLTKIPEPVGILLPPKSFEVTEGENPGSVNIEISPMEKAEGYIVLYFPLGADGIAPANNSEWHSKIFSKATGIITGLTSGIKYIFKAASTSTEANAINLYNFTEPVEKFIQ